MPGMVGRLASRPTIPGIAKHCVLFDIKRVAAHLKDNVIIGPKGQITDGFGGFLRQIMPKLNRPAREHGRRHRDDNSIRLNGPRRRLNLHATAVA